MRAAVRNWGTWRAFLNQPLSPSRLKDLFYRSSNLQYFKRLIQIPQLPEVRAPQCWCSPRHPHGWEQQGGLMAMSNHCPESIVCYLLCFVGMVATQGLWGLGLIPASSLGQVLLMFLWDGAAFWLHAVPRGLGSRIPPHGSIAGRDEE